MILDDLLDHLCFMEKMDRVLTYYQCEADDFLQNIPPKRVEAMTWLEERNQDSAFFNRRWLRVDGKKPEDCGREIVRMLYTIGAKKVSVVPIKPRAWNEEYTDTLFVEFPANDIEAPYSKTRMELWVCIINLLPKVALLEGEGLVVKVQF